MSSVLEDVDTSILANQTSYRHDFFRIANEFFDECIRSFEYLQNCVLVYGGSTGDQVKRVSGHHRQAFELLEIVVLRWPSIMFLVIAGGA